MNKLDSGVVFAFNVKAGVHIASMFARAGMLLRFVTLPVWASMPTIARAVPGNRGKALRSSLARRVVPTLGDIPSTKTVYGSELLLHGLHQVIPRVSLNTRLLLSQAYFDRAAARQLRGARVYHFASGVGADSGRTAKRQGALVVCQRRALHHEVESEIVSSLLGSQYRHPEVAMGPRLNTEYQVADWILCNSSLTARSFLTRGFPESKLRVIHNGVDTTFWAPCESARSEEKYRLRLLYAGSLDLRKGVDTLLSAVCSMQKEVELRIVGGDIDGTSASLRKEFSNVKYLGRLGPESLRAEYRSADVFILPSRVDAFGYVISEALACGTPVIASDMVGASDLLHQFRAGWTFKAGDVDSLRTAIRQAFSADALVSARAEAIRSRDYLDWSRFERELLEFYRHSILTRL